MEPEVDKTSEFSDFPPIGALMVSKMVAVEKRKPLFMYREKRSNPADSGWRIFSGFETEEYSDNPDNPGIYSPTTILKIDPSIASLLLKGTGAVFERRAGTETWYPVTDFELEDDFIIQVRLTETWEMAINNLFERRKEEGGDLFFTTGDKSLRLSVWDSDKNKTELIQEYQQRIDSRDQSMSKTLEVFDLSDTDVARIGYAIKESDERREYDVIYGFVIIDQQVIHAVFYYDDQSDKTWALDTWKSIKTR